MEEEKKKKKKKSKCLSSSLLWAMIAPASEPMETRQDTVAGATLLGKYVVCRLIGQGSFAKVYYAKAVADGAGFAVKVIDKKGLDQSAVPRILREVSVMRRLDHPNIIRLHEVMATKTKIYLVMEYAAGGELFKICRRRGPMKEAAARRFFRQLLPALRFCHSNGVAHRDLKTHNLLLGWDGELRVSDFGLAALPDQLHDGLLRTACGTPGYAAPEVVGGKGYDGAKADAWSCGAVLFELLAGFPLFTDTNLLALFHKIHKRQYQFPPWFSPPASRIIFRLLDPNPATRMTIDRAMTLPWFQKSYRPPTTAEDQGLFISPFPPEEESSNLTPMNAFHIISLSPGCDLSGIFETGNKTKKRFTTVAPAEKIFEQVQRVGSELGYRVENRKEGVIRLSTMTIVLLVEIHQIVPSLYLVEVTPGAGTGPPPEFENYWKDIKDGLEELGAEWQNDGI